MSSAVFKGVVHGKVIELEKDSGFPDGQKVTVQFQAEEEPPKWLERLTVDPSIALGKLLIKGTRLFAEDLARLVKEGRSDEEIRRMHAELTAEDMDAVRMYAKVPAGLRRAFGSWAEDGDELDNYLDLGHPNC